MPTTTTSKNSFRALRDDLQESLLASFPGAPSHLNHRSGAIVRRWR